jgi:hypothetical protein
MIGLDDSVKLRKVKVITKIYKVEVGQIGYSTKCMIAFSKQGLAYQPK